MPVIGTAGHVDHGKSTLVHALTGIDPDRLREEKERGLTIDLGFAWLTLPSGLEVGIVDVPGHERFIKNMLAGAGGIDLALLVVAADEGPRPQTSEHLAILDLLEVPAGIVVITKCDLVESEYIDLVEAELEDSLAGSRLAGAPVVRVSAATGNGLEDLRRAIDAALAALPPKRDLGRPRVPIDRVFTVKGFGTVVTGTLVDGSLNVGDELEVTPGGARCRVRGLQRHRTKVDTLAPGTRAAVNVSGLREEHLHRGMTLGLPGAVQAATSLAVKLFAGNTLAHELVHDTELTALCATAETQAKLRLLDADALARGRSAWAQLVFASAMPAVVGDHIILRTPNDTVAGGRIIAINGRRLRRNDAATLARLDQLLEGTPALRVLDALASGPATREDALARGETHGEAGRTALETLLAEGRALEFRGLLYTPDWLETQQERLRTAVARYLSENSLRPAAPKEHIRSLLRVESPVLDLLVEVSAAAGSIELRGAGLAPPGYTPSLSPSQAAEVTAFLAALNAQPYSPPTESQPNAQLLAYLAERHEIVDTGSGVVFAAEAFNEMTQRTRAFVEKNGSISMAEARDLFGNSRKYAQAFLEHLDALHITRRSGDTRTLR